MEQWQHILGVLILFAAALVLVVLELLLPTHGILAVLCALTAVAACGYAFWIDSVFGLIASILVLLASPLVLWLAVRIYPNTFMGKRVMLQRPAPSDTQSFAREQAALEKLLGQRGVAVTVLRPAGMAEIGDRRIDVSAEAGVIDPGTAVVVVKVTGLLVIVRPA
ncbi:MAG: NfeD family protein [Phycisphaerae bacterium]